MAFAIGYNVAKANELMERIAEAYNNLGIYTRDQWNPVSSTLQTEWVGEDEQNFEIQFAKRINELYTNAYNLASSGINCIADLAQNWVDFQSKNTFEGEASGKTSVTSKIEKPTVKLIDKGEIIHPKLKSISNTEDRGLKSDNSKEMIKSVIETFVGEIRKRTEGLFKEIQANEAFFGEQTQSIKNFVDKVGYAIGEVTIAMKDMYNALETLAGTSYTQSATDVSQQFTTNASNVENSLNDLGNSRWV